GLPPLWAHLSAPDAPPTGPAAHALQTKVDPLKGAPMKIIADLCIVPMGVGPSVSSYIREVRDILATTGLTHEMHANGTNIEGEMSEVSAAVEACCQRLHEVGVERIF